MSTAQWVTVLVVIGLAPLGLALLGSGIARLKGTRLDAAEAEPCFVAGVDISGVLYTLFMCHWLMIFTAPIGVGGVIWGAVVTFW
ncbi:hypothetical protein D4A39_08840 [Alcanivorax profundi]|uniref:Uncharacterized protein n=1 Tax=Alcanivorax profundi TaxID=2338368 RepID=A0A418XZW1_9GAMM|nr:hypothetical protein [Alcanivorax profundi]RJG18562.1 hypothetical protein D4A39_08840 [Alcanivorax profundi]